MSRTPNDIRRSISRLPRQRSDTFAAGRNFDGSPSFFDLSVFPTFGANFERQFGPGGGESATFNPNFFNTEIGQQELRRNQEIEAERRALESLQQQAGFDQLSSQLLGGPPQNPAELGQNVVDSINPAENLGGLGENAQTINNPFVQQQPPIDASPEAQAFADAGGAVTEARARKARLYAAEMSRIAGEGGTPRSLARARQQFAQRFPEYAQRFNVQPLSSAQVQELKQRMELEDTEKQLSEGMRAAGFDSPVKLRRNEKGELESIYNIEGVMRAETENRLQSERATQRDLDARSREYDARVKREDSLFEAQRLPDNPFDPTADPANFQEYEAFRQSGLLGHQNRLRSIRQELFPEEFDAPKEATVGRQQINELRGRANSQGVDLLIDQDDIEEFANRVRASGQRMTYMDANGDVYSVGPEDL